MAESKANQEDLEFFGSLACVTSCRCGWTFEGTAAEGRFAAAAHRREAHPDWRNRTRRKKVNLAVFRSAAMSSEEKEDVYSAREKRAFLHGVDLVD